MEQAKKTINQYQMLQQGDRVLVGISGGPDSVALMHFLWKMKDAYGISLYGVHVNHMIRPEAKAETEHVCRFADELQVPLKVYYRDVPLYAKEHGMSLEQAGHEIRFQCFAAAAEEWNCNRLALGHHIGDVTESVLMHLIQGCGPKGLIAMPPVSGWIIRPLISSEKEEMVQYCLGNKLHFDTDATNFEADCFRNRIRLELLPQLQQYNPEWKSAVIRLREILSDEDDYMEKETLQLWNQWRGVADNDATHPRVSFSREVFCRQHIAIRRRLLQMMWQEASGTKADLSFTQMEQMCGIADKKEGSQKLSLSHNIVFYREYDIIGMHRADELPKIFEVPWSGKEILELEDGEIQFRIISESEEGNGLIGGITAEFSAETIQFPLTIRTRREGDILEIRNGKHKKVKKLFIDKKIPASMRDRIPLVCSGETVLWIPGYYQNQTVMPKARTENILKICCIMK